MQLPKQKIYKKVFDIAREELLGTDLQSRCKAAGVSCESYPAEAHVNIPFLDETVKFTIPGFIFQSSKDANIILVSKIILLH